MQLRRLRAIRDRVAQVRDDLKACTAVNLFGQVDALESALHELRAVMHNRKAARAQRHEPNQAACCEAHRRESERLTAIAGDELAAAASEAATEQMMLDREAGRP